MTKKLILGLWLVLLLLLGLAACGGQESEVDTTGPVIIASAGPTDTAPSPTATAKPFFSAEWATPTAQTSAGVILPSMLGELSISR